MLQSFYNHVESWLENVMVYEKHDLNSRLLPFIYHFDVMQAGRRDYTHWHENIEILCFTEGRGRVICDYRRTDVAAGDIFVINSEELHMIESDNIVSYHCFIVDTDFCIENGIKTQNVRFESKINDPVVLQKYAELVYAYNNKDEFRDAGIRLAALGLLLSIAKKHVASEGIDSQTRSHVQNIKQAIKYIKENFQKNINIDGISEAAGLSRAYFSREFKELTGFTITNYVNLVRCQNACKLLRSGKYRVNEAAAECGFDNLSYFAKTYKKTMGILPFPEETA